MPYTLFCNVLKYKGGIMATTIMKSTRDLHLLKDSILKDVVGGLGTIQGPCQGSKFNSCYTNALKDCNSRKHVNGCGGNGGVLVGA